MASDDQDKRCLIINADDYGYCSQRNTGIVEAFCQGVVTSVSLLVNGRSSLEAIELARQHGIPMGLHLNLTEGLPLGKEHQTLIGCQGFLKGKMGFRDALHSGEILFEEIRSETAAQLDWFIQNVGCNPTHIDGHQHVHVLPIVSKILASVMKENSILMTRNPTECIDNCSWIESKQNAFLQSVIQDADISWKIFKEADICFPDHFIGLSTMGKNMTIENIHKALKKCLKDDQTLLSKPSVPGHSTVVELMVHPGRRSVNGIGGCGEGPDLFSLSEDREHELEILTSKQLKDFLKMEGFSLKSFSNINNSQK